MPRSRPEDLLLEYLDARERDASLTFDAFCAKHPAEANDLRNVFLGWQLAQQADGAKRSLAQKLKERFGSQADPGISLEHGADADVDPALLDALKSRGPSSSRYRLKGEVAQGGMGVILRVWDEDLRRHLAMKVMLDEQEGAASRLSRFLEEAQVTGQLDHPGIVPVHELGIDARGRVFFTMKLVKGRTLEHVFEAVRHGDDGWSVTRALSVVLRVCEAMAFAHEKGVIHRDLKPANIMVGRFGETYVMDWGLARVLGKKDTKDIRPQPNESVSAVRTDRRIGAGAKPDSSLLTMDGDQVGTPAYMPPEQARGDLERIGPHSDVYAVGAILYHLLSGQVPYVEPDTHATPWAILAQVLAGPPKPLHTLTNDVPAELLAICERAMERDPKQRYASMTDLANDLRAYLEHRVVTAYETGAIAEMKKWVQRNKGLASAAAALIVVLAGATVVVANKNREVEAKNVSLGAANAEISKQKSEVEEKNVEITKQKSEVEAKNVALGAANTEITRQKAEVEARKAEFDQLSGVVLLETAKASELLLYPAIPSKVDALRHWLENDAAKLLAMKPALIQTVADLEARALPWTDAEREADRASHPKLEELTAKRAEREALASASPTDETAKSLASLDAAIAELESEIAKRRTWTFGDESQRFLHSTLSALLSDLATFEADTVAGVRRRLTWAERIEDLTLHHPNARVTWNEARTALAKADDVAASTLYREMPIDLKPQIGLVPIGMNPVTKLWEFYDLRSACDVKAGEDPANLEIPVHREDGSIEMKDGTGIVFVLIPGGTFVQGAQKDDESAPNFDPAAQADESPQSVTLAPYFLARHEMTKGQWYRITEGDEPSWYRRGATYNEDPIPIGWTHPVETVSWEDCALRLPRAGLLLPTEAQWEYGARGGTETPWWTGKDASTLSGAGNVLDQLAQRTIPQWGLQEGDFDDGYVGIAPGGAFRANAFGLFDVHGNVLEWCAEVYANRYLAPRAGDGLRSPVATGTADRVFRGGSYSSAASFARSADRHDVTPSTRHNILGVRPARVLD
jgi:serine/threonine protein kinase/formylglycine-generating enzyme required for sulfatase activity